MKDYAMKTKALIYSKDRAFQLDACLSTLFYFTNIEGLEIVVLYKTTSETSLKQYNQLIEKYDRCCFVPENNLVIDTISQLTACEYVLFLVDDTIFYKRFDLGFAVETLSKDPESIGFSLRLGFNTDYCYMSNSFQRVPIAETINEVIRFNWIVQERDFGYPLEISSSIYRAADIIFALNRFSNQKLCPSLIESRLHNCRDLFLDKPFLLSFDKSAAFSCPVNLTKRGTNPHSRDIHYSLKQLEEAFDRGVRFDINKLKGLDITGCHQEIKLL